MYRPLTPCGDCRRHVLASASACPFCGSTRAADHAHEDDDAPTLHVSRSAAMALVAAMSLVGCRTEDTTTEAKPDPVVTAPKPTATSKPKPPPPDPGEVDDAGAMVTKYGAPPPMPLPPKPPVSAKPPTPPVGAYGGPPPIKP